jgi:tryptophan synthase alpha chain
MGRIEFKLQQLQRNALVCYITPDFPFTGCTEPIVLALEDAGADMIEIGIPFSDPLADGPVVQNASHLVLQKGITFKRILKIVENIRKKSEVPLIAMGYANSVLNSGINNYFTQLQAAGVDGVILPDVPIEEMDRFTPVAAANNIAFIPLVSPLSSEARIRSLALKGSGFIYCVSITGVTGTRSGNYFSGDLASFLSRVKKNSVLPALVGFGISEHEHIAYLEDKCDGYIIGSALLKAITTAQSIEGSVQAAVAFVRELMRGKR